MNGIVFKKAAIRLLALAMAFSTALASLCPQAAYADSEESTQSVSDTSAAESEASSEGADSQTDESSSEDTGMEVYKDGEKYGVKAVSASAWADYGVKGSEEPTLKALTTEEFMPGQDYSDADGDLYALTAATGINAGSSVEYIAIRYVDNSNTARTKYIFPKKFAAAETTDYITKFEAQHGSNLASGGSYYIINQRHKYLSDMGYSINKKGITGSLSSWSVDEYLFRADNGIQKVTGIEVFMSNGKWTVQGMTVSKVTGIGGYGEYGFYSGKYFLGLKKQRICELLSKKSGALTFSANGDTLLNIGGSNSSYFGLKQITGNESSSDPFKDVYTFRMDILDQLDAGLESLLRKDSTVSDPAKGYVAEDIALEIEYKDRNGWVRKVTMPVLLSVLGQYKQMNAYYGDTVRTVGLAQRGDTLAFSACLPEYASIVSTKVYVGKIARDRIAETGGIAPKNTNTVEATNLYNSLESDAIKISGISLYKGTCRMSNTPDGEYVVTDGSGNKSTKTLPSYTYAYDYSENIPILYSTTVNSNGIMINPGTTDSFTLKSYNPKDPLIAAKTDYNVLVQLRTDSIENSETSGDIKIRLSYQDTSGSEMITRYYNVKEEVLDYIGYWPTTSESRSNFGYSYGMTGDSVVSFPIQINNVGAITNVELSLAPDADEWQISGVCISVVNKIGRRKVYAQDISSSAGKSAFRFARTVDKTDIPPFPVDVSLLFTPGDSYSFTTGAGTIVKTREIDYNNVRYSMSYEETQDDYGFARAKKTYDVNVKVADDPDAGNANGDSGSRNHFYFQLRFNNGNSAYVLANQQLSSDGFRAGYNEVFAVKINRDYGDLSSIRIIPEDISEDSDVFDKLNIEQITVTERTNSGTAEQFVLDNIGWIGIDYHDKSQDVAIKTREGRSATMLSKTYNVSYKQMVINLLCEINTLPWDTDYLQVEGSISCDLEYIDQNDQPRTISFDVVSRMASYMNKTPRSLEAKADGSNAALYDNMGTISDPKWMLRPNHYDRFILPSLANPKIIKSMTFIATSRNNKPAKWVIGDVTLSRIMNDSGIVRLTSNGEYLRTMDTVHHCSMVKTDNLDYKELFLPAGEAQKITIYFEEQTIAWAEDKSWTASVSKLPVSSNDTLNVYIYPKSTTRNIDGVKVSMSAQYALANSRAAQVSQSEMVPEGSGTSDAVFYITGLSVPDMKNLNKLSIRCRDSKILFDHAIVQQERDGVIVRSYSVKLGNSSAILGLNVAPEATTKIYDPKKQVLMLLLGSGTEEKPLFPLTEDNLMPSDIAVALKYRSSLPGVGEYYSPYVYLSEAGYSKIYPGMMAEIPFDTPYVDEIVGYRIVSFGGLKATVENSMVINYSYSEKKTDPATGKFETTGDKREEVYSFNQTYSIENAIRDYTATATGMSGEGSLVPFQVSFVTAAAGEGSESGINVPVPAIIYYTDSSDSVVPFAVEDLRQYIQSENKSFPTGEEALVSLFLPDCIKLNSIKITPSSGEWNLDRIVGSMKLGEIPVNRAVNKIFDVMGGEISLSDPTLVTIITSDGSFKGLVTQHLMNVVCSGGSVVSGSVRTADNEGFDVKAEWLVNGIPSDVTVDTVSKTEEGFRFMTPVNAALIPQTYTITVWSTENSSYKDVINVTVPVPENTSYKSGNNDQDSSGKGSDTGDQQQSGDTGEEPPQDKDTPADEGKQDDQGGGTAEGQDQNEDQTDEGSPETPPDEGNTGEEENP